ncbi:MAG TPA: PAS domain S-box protein [Tahibacter sp.]|nr:PAS domain S-box protein [Tahibacter sp.]
MDTRDLLDPAVDLAAIIDVVPNAIVMVDREGRIVLVNSQAERLFGYARNELLGEPVDMLVPFASRASHPQHRATFEQSPKSRPMGAGRDLYGLRKDGSAIPLEIGLSPIQTPSGPYFVSAIVDLTERKRLEARFRATVESAPTAMVMIDQAGTIVLANAELTALFGYAREELLGRKVEILLPKQFQHVHPNLRAQYFADGVARRMGEGRDLFGMRRDGTEFPVEIGLNPVRTDEGMFVLGAIVDLTERTHQAQALRAANEALERSNIELQRFAYVASHDLQSPMRTIAGFVELLGAKYGEQMDERARDWIRRTVQATKHLQAMVSDLLEYSRFDSHPHPFERVDLAEVFDEVVTLLQAAIAESGATVSREDGLASVEGDRSQLAQLLLNLVGNAIKYRGGEPVRVSVAARALGGEWRIGVTDNGIGIDPGCHEKIFEIFRRLHTKEYPGTGIGLAVARRIVNGHGGRIWVESKPGEGSTFYFTLKAYAGE